MALGPSFFYAMSFVSEIREALAEAEGTTSVTFIYDNTTYSAIASNETRSLDGGFAGLEIEDSVTLIIRPDSIAVMPRPREKITYNGRLYEIQSIEKAPADAFFKFICATTHAT